MTNAEQFRAIEARMKLECPNFIDEAEKLAVDIAHPETSGPLEIWAMLWDKPLYANTRVKTATMFIERIAPFAAGEKWREWSERERPFVTLDGPANREPSFAVTTFAPQGLAMVRIAKNRLFAIQGAAQALAKWTGANARTPFDDALGRDSADLIPSIIKDLGKRWAHITVMHFLTDMGLSCKPDRWLARTVCWLGLVEGIDAERGVPNLREAILIDAAVKQLVRDVDGELTPRRLRYFDKVLMEASRQKIIEGPC